MKRSVTIDRKQSRSSRAIANSVPLAQQRTATRSTPIPFHPLVWLVWLVAGVAAITTNPLLNVLVLVQALLVAITCHTESPVGRAWRIFLWIGAVFVVIRTLLSAIPVGGFTYGSTPLFTVPAIKLPIWLGGLDLGGTATLEMIVGGLVGGIRLWALVLIFGAFNAVADHYGLLRRTPRFLFHAGLMITIALTFVPQVIVQLGMIRDAQRVRGHRFRSWRDGLSLIVPLLSGGLERSIQLAEAMDSRGYGYAAGQQPSTGVVQGGLIIGLSALALGLFFGFSGDQRGWIAVGIGAIVIVLALRRLNTGTPRTRYLRERWRDRDTLVLLASLALISGMLWLRINNAGDLLYTPLPRVTWPRFDPLVGGLLLLLSMPAIITFVQQEETHERSSNLRHSYLADRIE